MDACQLFYISMNTYRTCFNPLSQFPQQSHCYLFCPVKCQFMTFKSMKHGNQILYKLPVNFNITVSGFSFTSLGFLFYQLLTLIFSSFDSTSFRWSPFPCRRTFPIIIGFDLTFQLCSFVKILKRHGDADWRVSGQLSPGSWWFFSCLCQHNSSLETNSQTLSRIKIWQ